MEVAGHRLGPGVGDPDRRPAERVVVEADPLHVGARVGAVGAVEDGGRARAREAWSWWRRCVLIGSEIYWRGQSARPKRSTGPAPAPSSRRPAPTASEAIRRAAPGGLERARRRAPGRRRAPRNGCSRSRARRRPDGARPRSAPPRARRRRGRRSRSLWPPVTTTARGPSASTAARQLLLGGPLPQPGQRLAPRGCSASPRRPAAAAARPAPRGPPSSSRVAPLSATITGSTTTGASPTKPSASTTASTVAAVPSIPILTASTPMSSATARTWATIISGATASTPLTPDRVLRRDRGDRRHPVHAAARERLEVGLDAGAAAGVRAGDREDGWDWCATRSRA